jgi:Putative translation initiation inhibitor, yjgF family
MNNNVQVYGKRNPAMPFHPAVRAGDFVFVSGVVARSEAGPLVSASIEEETRVTLDAMKRVLEAAGCGLEDVVNVTTYLEDSRDFGRYNEVFKQYFPEGRLARTTVEARMVISCKVEIDCVAYRPLERS